MYRFKDIYGEPHLLLEPLGIGLYNYPRKIIPITIEALEFEIRITKGIIKALKSGENIWD